MGLLLNLHSSSYVIRNTQNFSITANVILLFLSRVMKDAILICLMTDYSALIYVNGKCKHKYIRPFSVLGTQASFVD